VHLKTFTKLSYLDLGNATGSDAGVTELKRILPNLKIIC
jgi:hypothetical protein